MGGAGLRAKRECCFRKAAGTKRGDHTHTHTHTQPRTQPCTHAHTHGRAPLSSHQTPLIVPDPQPSLVGTSRGNGILSTLGTEHSPSAVAQSVMTTGDPIEPDAAAARPPARRAGDGDAPLVAPPLGGRGSKNCRRARARRHRNRRRRRRRPSVVSRRLVVGAGTRAFLFPIPPRLCSTRAPLRLPVPSRDRTRAIPSSVPRLCSARVPDTCRSAAVLRPRSRYTRRDRSAARHSCRSPWASRPPCSRRAP